MTQPWESEYRKSRNRNHPHLRYRVKRKIKTGLFALGLVTMCYLAVAKHTFKAAKTAQGEFK